MILPSANCSFNIPSLNDDLELNCRLYFPRRSPSSHGPLINGFTIFAHPYASLGGCYDDPIVQLVGSILLREGFVLCTFNFRGAGGSPGRTTWTGKSELADYVSVYTFMLHLMSAPDMLDYAALPNGHPILVLGGYSYGSMITSNLPDLEIVQLAHDPTKADSSDHEIKLRGKEMAQILLGYLEAQSQRGRSNLRIENMNHSPTSMREVMVGGYDSDNAGRRISRSSPRRSIDVERVRHSIDRARHKLISKDSMAKNNHQTVGQDVSENNPFSFKVRPLLVYLLVSPLLQPVSGFTTVFSRLSYERKGAVSSSRAARSMSQNLTEHSTLAIFGDKDGFTSSRRLRKWCQGLQSMPASEFKYEEIVGAGHFWHEAGVSEKLCTSVRDWLKLIVNKNRSPTLKDG